MANSIYGTIASKHSRYHCPKWSFCITAIGRGLLDSLRMHIENFHHPAYLDCRDKSASHTHDLRKRFKYDKPPKRVVLSTNQVAMSIVGGHTDSLILRVDSNATVNQNLSLANALYEGGQDGLVRGDAHSEVKKAVHLFNHMIRYEVVPHICDGVGVLPSTLTLLRSHACLGLISVEIDKHFPAIVRDKSAGANYIAFTGVAVAVAAAPAPALHPRHVTVTVVGTCLADRGTTLFESLMTRFVILAWVATTTATPDQLPDTAVTVTRVAEAVKCFLVSNASLANFTADKQRQRQQQVQPNWQSVHKNPVALMAHLLLLEQSRKCSGIADTAVEVVAVAPMSDIIIPSAKTTTPSPSCRINDVHRVARDTILIAQTTYGVPSAHCNIQPQSRQRVMPVCHRMVTLCEEMPLSSSSLDYNNSDTNNNIWATQQMVWTLFQKRQQQSGVVFLIPDTRQIVVRSWCHMLTQRWGWLWQNASVAVALVEQLLALVSVDDTATIRDIVLKSMPHHHTKSSSTPPQPAPQQVSSSSLSLKRAATTTATTTPVANFSMMKTVHTVSPHVFAFKPHWAIINDVHICDVWNQAGMEMVLSNYQVFGDGTITDNNVIFRIPIQCDACKHITFLDITTFAEFIADRLDKKRRTPLLSSTTPPPPPPPQCGDGYVKLVPLPPCSSTTTTMATVTNSSSSSSRGTDALGISTTVRKTARAAFTSVQIAKAVKGYLSVTLKYIKSGQISVKCAGGAAGGMLGERIEDEADFHSRVSWRTVVQLGVAIFGSRFFHLLRTAAAAHQQDDEYVTPLLNVFSTAMNEWQDVKQYNTVKLASLFSSVL
jgi:hypothetical protein